MIKQVSKEVCDERGREYYFDNAKFILIFFVVLAHLCSPLKSYHGTVDAMWIVINNLHMPCLIFISGYFAKSYIRPDGSVKLQRLLTYVVYYVAAQLAVSLFEYFVLGDTDMEKSLFDARSSLWYLQCLIMWFVVLPYVAKLNKKFVMIVSVIIGIVIGYDTAIGTFLSISRVFIHFPFFIGGYYFKKEWFYKFRNKYTQIISAAVFVVLFILAYNFHTEIPKRIVTASFNYYTANLSVSMELAWIYRVIFYIVAAVSCAAFMLLVPMGKTFFTVFGKRTLQVYILHRFIYLAEQEYEWWMPFDSPMGCVLMALIALVTTFILSLKPFEYPFKWLGNIKINKLLKKDET